MAAVIPYVQDTDFTLHVGDVRQVLAELPAESVDCCVTSPPYWGLRDYGTAGQIGLEQTPEEFVAEMVAVFRQVRRVLAPHGTLWLNLGDSYASGGGYSPDAPSNTEKARRERGQMYRPGKFELDVASRTRGLSNSRSTGLKHKDLVGIPWRVAFALQADGWYLRADIIWSKPNPMPESVTDRPTKAHEYVFLLSKQPRYFFDQEAVREQASPFTRPGRKNGERSPVRDEIHHRGGNLNLDYSWQDSSAGRNVRSVWEIATQPYPDAHFATFPEALPERCIKAGCPVRVCVTCGKASERIVDVSPMEIDCSSRTHLKGQTRSSGTVTKPRESTTTGFTDCGHGNYRTGVVLDPFMGSGTTALVARRHGRHAIGVELNLEYAELAARRLSQLSLLAEEAAG